VAGKPFAPFAALLGVTMEQMGMKEDDKELTSKHMIQYVHETNLPIGLLDARRGIKIGFVRPRIGTFDTVTIIVYWEDKIGILIQEEGNSTVQVKAMPLRLQEKWEDAHMPPVEEEKEVAPEQKPVMAKQKRKPLVAQFPQAPLVQAPIIEKKQNNKKQKRKPRVGALPSFVKTPVKTPKRKPRVGKRMDASEPASAIPEAAVKRSGKKPSVGVM
jgi:hypothetical protein